MKFIFWVEAAFISFAVILLQITDSSKNDEQEYESRFRMNRYSFSEKIVYHFAKCFSRLLTNTIRYLCNGLLLAKKMFIEETMWNFDNLLVITDMLNNVNAVKDTFWDMLFLFFKDEL
ncbi:hypothetical protein FQR65_LT13313 [Abscondita terminalis]|nr:hypothetical protein FQR65_LT13313 [Abscondita terminalis]